MKSSHYQTNGQGLLTEQQIKFNAEQIFAPMNGSYSLSFAKSLAKIEDLKNLS